MQEVRVNIQQRIAKQFQELEAEFRKGHKSYVAKIKGQAIEEYRPDLSLNSKPAGAGGASSFFEDEPESTCVDPRFSAQQTLQLVMMDQMSAEREKQINQARRARRPCAWRSASPVFVGRHTARHGVRARPRRQRRPAPPAPRIAAHARMPTPRVPTARQVAESVNDLADIFKEIQVLVIDQGTVLDRIDYNIEQAASKVRLPRRRAAVTSRAVVGATAVAVFRKLCDKARRTCACLVV